MWVLELSLDPLAEQPVLLIPETPLQSLHHRFIGCGTVVCQVDRAISWRTARISVGGPHLLWAPPFPGLCKRYSQAQSVWEWNPAGSLSHEFCFISCPDFRQ